MGGEGWGNGSIRNGQKGVDARIVRDLIVLSRNGAVSTAYLMSGDEDVREGVLEAQEFGVRVVLLGIECPPGRANQAQALIREADDLITFSYDDCSGFISRVTERAHQPVLVIPPDVPADAKPTEFGEACGRSTRDGCDSDVLSRILAKRPHIPRAVDAGLITEAASRFGEPLPERARHQVRAGFWKGLVEGLGRAKPEEGGVVNESPGDVTRCR